MSVSIQTNINSKENDLSLIRSYDREVKAKILYNLLYRKTWIVIEINNNLIYKLYIIIL